jgi:hypothetical protein
MCNSWICMVFVRDCNSWICMGFVRDCNSWICMGFVRDCNKEMKVAVGVLLSSTPAILHCTAKQLWKADDNFVVSFCLCSTWNSLTLITKICVTLIAEDFHQNLLTHSSFDWNKTVWQTLCVKTCIDLWLLWLLMLVTMGALVACYLSYQCYPCFLGATVMWLYQKHFALLTFRILLLLLLLLVASFGCSSHWPTVCMLWPLGALSYRHCLTDVVKCQRSLTYTGDGQNSGNSCERYSFLY